MGKPKSFERFCGTFQGREGVRLFVKIVVACDSSFLITVVRKDSSAKWIGKKKSETRTEHFSSHRQMKCRKGRPPFLDTRSLILTVVEPLDTSYTCFENVKPKHPLIHLTVVVQELFACSLHLLQFPWKVPESRIQNPSWRKMGQRDKRHEKSKKGRTGMNSSIYICAWFVMFLKLLHCMCLFVGYSFLPKPPRAEAKYCQKLSGDLVEI